MAKIYHFNLGSYCSNLKGVEEAHYTESLDFQINIILIPLHIEEDFYPFLFYNKAVLGLKEWILEGRLCNKVPGDI